MSFLRLNFIDSKHKLRLKRLRLSRWKLRKKMNSNRPKKKVKVLFNLFKILMLSLGQSFPRECKLRNTSILRRLISGVRPLLPKENTRQEFP